MDFFINIFYQVRFIKKSVNKIIISILQFKKLPNEISQKENIMPKVKLKKTPYVIRLMHEDTTAGTYRVSKEIFLSVTKELKPYQSFSQEPKKIRCVETEEIFKNAKEVIELLIQQGKSTSYSAFSRIKDVCNKKREKAYGYHWEFIEN